MKSLAIINSLESGSFTAAVVENLKEVGKELTIIGDDDNEELGYPEGLLMSMQNKHGIMVDCVYDRIKIENDKVMLHQAYWDDGENDYWQHSEDIGTDNLLTIYSAIDWENYIPKGEDEPTKEKLSWLLSCHYNLFHSDIILRAAFDDSISHTEFLRGCVDIHLSEKDTDDTEFTPKGWENV